MFINWVTINCNYKNYEGIEYKWDYKQMIDLWKIVINYILTIDCSKYTL